MTKSVAEKGTNSKARRGQTIWQITQIVMQKFCKVDASGTGSIFSILPDEIRGHKADYVPYYAEAVASRYLAKQRV
jgi:hypothetical protein